MIIPKLSDSFPESIVQTFLCEFISYIFFDSLPLKCWEAQ